MVSILCTHFLKVKNVFSRRFFQKIMPLCMVSIQEQFLIKSALWWRRIRYSEKATKFCEISILLLSVSTVDKSEVQISQNFLVFSEYTNFIKLLFAWSVVIFECRKKFVKLAIAVLAASRLSLSWNGSLVSSFFFRSSPPLPSFTLRWKHFWSFIRF